MAKFEIKLLISFDHEYNVLYLKDREDKPLGKEQLQLICDLFNKLLDGEKEYTGPSVN